MAGGEGRGGPKGVSRRMTRRLYYNGLSRPLGVHLFLVSRRQRKRSTFNKIRVQRLINITQNASLPTTPTAFGFFRSPSPFHSVFRYCSLRARIFISTERALTTRLPTFVLKKMAVPPIDSRNLQRISAELGFLEETLSFRPADQPEHARAWVPWLQDFNKQWASSRSNHHFPFLTSRLLSTGRVPRHPQQRWFPGGSDRRAPRKRAERSESQKGGGAYFRPTPRP